VKTINISVAQEYPLRLLNIRNFLYELKLITSAYLYKEIIFSSCGRWREKHRSQRVVLLEHLQWRRTPRLKEKHQPRLVVLLKENYPHL
jgi:hypothetical protein